MKMRNNQPVRGFVGGIITIMFFLGTTPTHAHAAVTKATTTSATTTAAQIETATTREILLFLGNQNIAPVVFIEDNQPAGVVVDIVRALTPYLSKPIDVRAMDWPTAQTLVTEGKADALIQINSTEERKKIYDFSDPLLESQFSIFARTSRVDVIGLASLHNLRVGVEKGGLPEQTLEAHPDIELVTIPNFLDGFKQLTDGTLDAIVVDYRVGSYVLAKNNIQGIHATTEPIASSYSAIAVKKGDAKLLNEINTGLKAIKANGVYQAILMKWKPTEAVFQTQEQITRNILIAVIVVLAILSLFVIVWSITINNELSKRRKAERYAQKLIESANAMIVALDTNGNVTTFNEAAEKITGYKKDEILGRNWFELVVPRSRFPQVWGIFEKTKKQEGPIAGDFQNPILTKNGEERTIEWRNSEIRDNGNIVGTLSYGIDVTEREKTRTILVETSKNLNNAQRLAHLGSWDLDLKTNKLTWSDEIYHMFEIDKTKFGATYEAFLDAIHPDDRVAVNDAYTNSLKTKTPYAIDHRLLMKDGRIKYVHEECETIYATDGTPLRSTGTVQDITERKKIADSLEKTLDELQDLYDNAPCGYHSLDEYGTFVRINKTELEWLGYTEEELLKKKKFTDIITPESVQTFQKNFPKFKETGAIRDIQFDMIRKDGSLLPIMVTATAIHDSNGNYLMSRSTVYDMTERRKAESEILQKNRALRMLSETNQALIHATEEQKLLDRVCDIIVKEGGYQSAWIGYQEGMHGTIRPIAQAGLVTTEKLKNDNAIESCDPCAVAITTKEPFIVQDINKENTAAPWKTSALSHGYQSIITLPLMHNDNAFAVIGIYAAKPEVFSESTVRILKEMSEDLSFGINTLRIKAARDKAEDELADERDLFVGGPTVVFKWRAAEGWPVEYVSPNVFQQFGYTQDDLTSGRIAYPSIIHPDDLARIADEVEMYSEQGLVSFEQNYRIANKDGKYRWINDYTRVSHGSDGRIDYYNGYIIDITEKKESEEKYRTLIQKIQAAVIVHSADTKIITSNTVAQELLGLTEDQLSNKTSFDPAWNFYLENGEVAPPSEYPVNIVLATRKPLRNHTLRVHRPNQKQDVWVLVNADPVFDERNELTQIIVTFVDITEHKQIEEEIIRSEERFSAAFHASPNMIAITRLSNGTIIDVNESYVHTLGYTREESIGKTTIELSIWVDLKDRAKFVEELNKHGQITDFEVKLRRKDGNIITAIDSARTITINGELCILSIINDITERKEAERKLLTQERYSQSLLRLSRKIEQSQLYGEILSAAQKEIKELIGYTNVWAYLIDEDRRYARSIAAAGSFSNVVMSEEFTATLKIEGDPMLEAIASAKEIVIVEDCQTDPNVNREIVEKLHNRTLVNVPITLFDRNLGSVGMGTFGDEGVRVPNKEEQDFLIAMASHMAVGFDRIRLLNEKTKAQKELLKTNQILTEEKTKDEALLESLGEGIIAIDKQGVIVASNHAAEQITGWKEEEILGKNIIEAIPATDENNMPVSREKRLAISVLKSKTGSETGILHYVRRDGKTVPVAITATPFILNDETIGAVNVFHDVTKEKELEETRKDLLSLASHQLRTPLSGTKWLIETLQKGIKGPLNKEQEEYLSEIYRINERMTTLVHDMLGVLRMESGTLPTTIAPVLASKIINAEIDNLSSAAKGKNITLETKIDHDHILNTDPTLLQQLLEVFVSNAITYSETGKNVVVSFDQDQKEAVFAIKDSGIGIPQDEQGRVFERFYRASNAKTFDTRGTGLGLHIATILAKKLGATLAFESKEGVGSTFFIHLPLSEQEEKAKVNS